MSTATLNRNHCQVSKQHSRGRVKDRGGGEQRRSAVRGAVVTGVGGESGGWSSVMRRSARGCRGALLLAVLLACMCRTTRSGWIDPDTPEEFRTIRSLEDGSEFELVS